MKDFLHKNKWFTLIEIVVAIIISSLVILWLTTLLIKINQEIFLVQTKTVSFSDFSRFQNDFYTYKLKYPNLTVVDNTSWYDVLLLTNSWSSRWLLIWVVDNTTNSTYNWKLDPVSNYNVYWDKVLWLKELSATQTQNILTNSWAAYSIKFSDSNLYKWSRADSFVVESYNSWAIYNIKLDLITNFNPAFIWQDRDSVVDSDTNYRIDFSIPKDSNIYIWPYSCVWTIPNWNWAILSQQINYSSWLARNYSWTWILSETWTLAPCLWKCNTVWYEGNIWWIDGYTTLLLHWDWPNNSTVFTDSELTPKSVSVAGDSKISTALSKFGSSSMYFDWAWDYLTLPNSNDWEFGSWDFTIDWWEYRTACWNRPVLARDSSMTFTPFLIGYCDGGSWFSQIYITSNWSSWDIASGKSLWTTTFNIWNHFAVVRNGNNFYIFKNGFQTDSWTSSLSILANSNSLNIARWEGSDFAGYLDELRISKWVARRTSNFTPPTMSYNTLSTAMCKIDSYTTLLLHWDWNLNNSWSSISTITNNWWVSYSWWLFWQWINFNWSNSLSIQSSDDWNFWTGNFTIDLWINPSISHTDNDIIDFWPTLNTDARIMFWTNNNFYYFLNWDWNCTVADTSWTPIWQWTHYAIVRNWTDIYLFKNWNLSVQHSNCTKSISYNAPIIIWKRSDGGTSFNWLLDEVRISKWVARWTSNFILPSSSY